jgi:hypothetical protein
MNLLPQSILNLIGEFNADHRDGMNHVFNELFINEWICTSCVEYIENELQKCVARILFKRYVFCCERCRWDGDETIREQFMRRQNNL